MSFDSTNRDLLEAWKSGDELAASVLYARFQARLLALVRSRLSRRLARRIDPEDVLLSAYRSFFVAARKGRVTPTQTDDLWPVLVTLTLRKLARQSRTHSARQRSVDHEQHDDSGWLQQLISDDPAPETAALLEDEVQSLSDRLSSTDREILILTLQGNDAVTIAERLSISERTVRRTLEKIRQLARDPSNERLLVKAPQPPQRLRQPLTGQTSESGTITYDQLLLQKLVGVGAFSKVYKALDRRCGEVVAVKFLRRDCWNDIRARNSIVQEWKSLATVRHANVLRVRDWGTSKRGGLFLVTEFIPGGNLEDWSRSADRSIEETLAAVKGIAKGIIAAHQAGVLHCDLKPSNVLRRDDGLIIVCDFGLSRWLQDPDDVPRGGTAGFLCPEQVSDAFGRISESSDVYGVGAVTYSLLTGQPPMTGRDLPAILANVLSATPPAAPSSLRRDISSTLEAVILKSLHKEPAKRFSTVAQFIEALQSVDQPSTRA